MLIMFLTTTISLHPCNASSTKSDASDESRSLLSNAERLELVQNPMQNPNRRFTQASGPVVEHEKPMLLQPPRWEKRKIPKSSGTLPRSDLSDSIHSPLRSIHSNYEYSHSALCR